MKLNKTYLVGIVALAVVLFVLQMRLPQRYEWKPTHAPTDRNPFGAYVLDSILAQTMPRGYEATDSTLYQVAGAAGDCNVLVTVHDFAINDLDSAALKSITDRGGKVMLACNTDGMAEERMSRCYGAMVSRGEDFSLTSLRRQLAEGSVYLEDSIRWVAAGYPSRHYRMYSAMMPSMVYVTDSAAWTTMADNAMMQEDEETGEPTMARVPVVARRKLGRGELIMVSVPLLFTNYAVLDGRSSGLVFRLMNELADKPVVRVYRRQGGGLQGEGERSIFDAIFKSEPLTWALYGALLLVALFFVFTARRRERVIPVVRPPQNHTLEFVQLIGTLYFLRRDHAGLVKTKFLHFAEVARRNAGVDVFDTTVRDHAIRVLSTRCGQPYEAVAETLRALRYVYFNESGISERQMKALVDKMRQLEKALKA